MRWCTQANASWQSSAGETACTASHGRNGSMPLWTSPYLHMAPYEGHHTQHSVRPPLARLPGFFCVPLPPSPPVGLSACLSVCPQVAAGVTSPSVGLLTDAFKTDVASELPHEDLAQDALSFEWDKLLNTSTPAPFLSCAGNGRAGVQAMLGNFSHGSVVPFYSTRDKNLTCYVIYSSAPTLLNATSDSGGTR